MNSRKTILIDLDGVLNTYNGKYDEAYIPPPRVEAADFLNRLAKNFDIKIFTSRNKLLTSKWLIKNNLDKYISEVTNVKEPAWIIIDDRCLNFNGNFNKILNDINNFKVWYKRI